MKRMSTAIYWHQGEESTVVIQAARTAFYVDSRYVSAANRSCYTAKLREIKVKLRWHTNRFVLIPPFVGPN
jgi:hypothetical protein